MSFSISALCRPLAVTVVTAALFSVVACSGPDPTSAPPPGTNPDGNDALLAAGALGAKEVSKRHGRLDRVRAGGLGGPRRFELRR